MDYFGRGDTDGYESSGRIIGGGAAGGVAVMFSFCVWY